MIDTLLAPISAEAPCGPDLEYDVDFLELQRCATARPEEQYGDVVIAAQSPAWRDVERLALALLARTKDLRIVVPLTWAWIDSRGLQGYADGLRLASALLDAYWEPLHPALLFDDEADPLPRFNALAELAGPQGCVRAAREQTLIGTLSASAAAELLQQGDGAMSSESGNVAGNSGYAGGRVRLLRELHEAHAAGNPALLAALAVREQLEGLRRRTSERLGEAWTIDKSAFERQLAALAAELPQDMPEAAKPSTPPGEEQNAPPQRRAAGPPAVNGAHGASGTNSANDTSGTSNTSNASGTAWRDAEISSRADIDFGLEKMCRYLELHEPSHPAPIFLRRAQRLLSLNFYEIFRDIAPESVRELDHLSGNRNDSPP